MCGMSIQILVYSYRERNDTDDGRIKEQERKKREVEGQSK